MRIIAVIPARGGSKGIPRKNLRPLAGKPLIYYSIRACLGAKSVSRVVVTTDDEEIALMASRFGAEVVMRPATLAGDAITLDPVIEHAVREVSETKTLDWDYVLTVQPTSPLITGFDIDQAMRKFVDSGCDTVLSVVDDRHLCWTVENGKPVPEYGRRVNRQELKPRFRETGAMIACRARVLERGSRIGQLVSLHEMAPDKSLDIDTISDFYLCESLLRRKKIAFVVCGDSTTGTGHVFRAVTLANEMVCNEVEFVVSEKDDLAAAHIDRHNYRLHQVPTGQLLNTLKSIQPDLVINDILDTAIGYVKSLKESGFKVVNFEDLGSGTKAADLVVNALYPMQGASARVLSGPDYFCLRDEFLHIQLPKPRERVENVLLCFGGVDEGNLTCRTLAAISATCASREIGVTIVLGPGYRSAEKLEKLTSRLNLSRVEVVKSTSRISDFMAGADVAVTSGGRTVFELAALAVPTIVICQNDREMTHRFATEAHGITNLGHRDAVTEQTIRSAFEEIVSDGRRRQEMRKRVAAFDLRGGKKRVTELIQALLEHEDA